MVSVLCCGVVAPADVISYWAFDDDSDFSRSLGDTGTLSVAPEGWFTKVSFPTGGTSINRIDIEQSTYQYMRIDDPVSLLTVGKIKILELDLTGYSDLELSLAAYLSHFISLEFDREVVCYVDDSEVWRQSFSIAHHDWGLTTIDLPSDIDNESDVRIELQFHDLLDIDYNLHVDNLQLTGVPEPATLMVMAAGLPVLLTRRRRRG